MGSAQSDGQPEVSASTPNRCSPQLKKWHLSGLAACGQRLLSVDGARNYHGGAEQPALSCQRTNLMSRRKIASSLACIVGLALAANLSAQTREMPLIPRDLAE